ncbi:hypothetical protein E4U53_006843 [Claviceps sorghi]|nr:hypothetical protein E4U53_006843 [Claviceps sorghi]
MRANRDPDSIWRKCRGLRSTTGLSERADMQLRKLKRLRYHEPRPVDALPSLQHCSWRSAPLLWNKMRASARQQLVLAPCSIRAFASYRIDQTLLQHMQGRPDRVASYNSTAGNACANFEAVV